jgi:transposase
LLLLKPAFMQTPQQASDCKQFPSIKKQKTGDFDQHHLYVGIDVHKKRWQVAVLCQGVVLGNVSIEADSNVLIRHLRGRYGEANFHCVYEAGPCGFALCRSLWVAGFKCMVVNPADIPDTDRERRSKTDVVDARKLAQHLAAGLLHGVHVPSEKQQKQRSLIRFRKKLWGDLCRVKNRLKSELLFQGITIPQKYDTSHWSHNFLYWIEEQVNRDDDLKDTLLLMLEEVKLLRGLLLKTEKKLREWMRSEAYVQKAVLLRSIPGIGPLTTMLFLLEIGDVARFPNSDSLNRFVGLCPDSHSSGQRERHTGLTRRAHNPLRSALVESAWQLIRKDPVMLEHYKKLCGRMKGPQAIIRIARRLLRRMRAVLLSGRMYVRGVEEGGSEAVGVPALPQAKPKGRPRNVMAAS